MQDNTNTIELLHAKALQELNKKNYEEAKECLIKIIELEPYQESYRTEIASVYSCMASASQEVGHHNKALEYALAACKYDPNNQLYTMVVFASYTALCAQSNKTSTDAAYEYLTPLLALNISKNNPIRKYEELEIAFTQTCTNFIMKAMYAEKYAQVKAVLPKIIEQEVWSSEVLERFRVFSFSLGSYAIQQAKLANAIEIFSIGLTIDQNNDSFKSKLSDTYRLRGSREYSGGHYSKALESFFNALAIVPMQYQLTEYIAASIIALKNENFVDCNIQWVFSQVLKFAIKLKDDGYLNFMLLCLIPSVKEGVYEAQMHLAAQGELIFCTALEVQMDKEMMWVLNTILKGKNNIERVYFGTEITFSNDAVALIKENLHLWTSLFSLYSENLSFKKEDIQFSRCEHLLGIPGDLKNDPFPTSTFELIKSDVNNKIGVEIFAKYKLNDLYRSMFSSKDSIGSYCTTLMKKEILISLCCFTSYVQDSNVETHSISLPTEVIQLILDYMASFYMLKAIIPQ